LQAISLWQPYASLIAAKVKPFETRHWAVSPRLIGQRVAIHAALRRPTQAEVAELFDDVAEALGFCHWHQRIPYGAIVCTAKLIGCHRVTHWNGPKPVLGKRGEIKDDGFGDYSTGRYCWELGDVQVFDPAIPAKGGQGWWNWHNL
jgi:hypothetical protein